jgi:Protein of unknown function (DUF2752)
VLRRERWSFGHPESFAGIFALAFLAARFLPVLGLGYRCPAKALLGVPCFTCGMTHAFVALAHGDVAAALAASPAGALLAAAGWAFAIAALARPILRFGWPEIGTRAARRLAVSGVLVLLLNWVYLVATGARA